MFPTSTGNNIANRGLGDTKPCGKHVASDLTMLIELSNLKNLGFTELCNATGFTSVLPLLCTHIGVVVRFGSKKQVLGIATGRHVAFVKDAQSIRDRAICEFPSETMSEHGLSVWGWRCFPDPAVPLPISRPLPQLTASLIGGREMSAQSHLDRDYFRLSTSVRAEAPASPLQFRKENKKTFFAGFASARDFGTLAGSHRSISFDRLVCGQARRGVSASRRAVPILPQNLNKRGEFYA